MRNRSTFIMTVFFIMLSWALLQGSLLHPEPSQDVVTVHASTQNPTSPAQPLLLVLYGSQQDASLANWLMEGTIIESILVPLESINDSILSSLNWSRIRAAWIINSNTTMKWNYHIGVAFTNIIKHEINAFVMSPYFEWIDPFYWEYLGIKNEAWHEKYLLNNTGVQAYRMSIKNTSFLPETVEDVITQSNLTLDSFLGHEYAISAISTWVKFESAENRKKLIELTALDAGNNSFNTQKWESGTIVTLNDKNIIITSTFFPDMSEIPISDQKRNAHSLNEELRNKNMFEVLLTATNASNDSSSGWNALRIVATWTTMFTFPAINDNQVESSIIDQVIPYLPALAIGSVVLLGMLYVLNKLGIIKTLLEKVLTVSISFIFLIGSITYVPLKRRISEEDLLENEIRRKIVDYLEMKGSSGAHLREIQAHVNKSISSVLWHLQALKQFGVVNSKKVGKYKIFYLSSISMKKTGDFEEIKSVDHIRLMEWSTLMKSDVAKKIVLLLLKSSKPLKLAEIAKAVKCHHETARYHLLRMLEMGMISSTETSKSKKSPRYHVNHAQRATLAQLVLNE